MGKEADFNRTPDSSNSTAHRGKRAMKRAELLGKHTHSCSTGINIHIYWRGGKYLARGRINRKMFGETLGQDENEAGRRLMDLICKMERGVYIRPSDDINRPFPDKAIPRFTLCELCSEFIAEKRKTKGQGTAKDYESRLAHCLDFADLKTNKRRWPLAKDVDREFAIDLKIFLMHREVSRNGRSGGKSKPMSLRQNRNCLEALRAVLIWAGRADVRKLPADFVNPITVEIIGPSSSKDPLRKPTFPIERRIAMVNAMDKWELLHLSFSMVMPPRPDEIAGFLISDVDFDECTITIGNRFGGSDFNKNRLNVKLPLPMELMSIIRVCVAGRPEGPLFRTRAVWEGRRRPQLEADSREHLEQLFNEELKRTRKNRVLAPRDRKEAFRHMLGRMGGLSADQIGKGLKKLIRQVDGNERPYDLRGSITSDLKASNVRDLELHYLTIHKTNDILCEYTGLDPREEMEKYFRRCHPLLEAILIRAQQLEIDMEPLTSWNIKRGVA